MIMLVAEGLGCHRSLCGRVAQEPTRNSSLSAPLDMHGAPYRPLLERGRVPLEIGCLFVGVFIRCCLWGQASGK